MSPGCLKSTDNAFHLTILCCCSPKHSAQWEKSHLEGEKWGKSGHFSKLGCFRVTREPELSLGNQDFSPKVTIFVLYRVKAST